MGRPRLPDKMKKMRFTVFVPPEEGREIERIKREGHIPYIEAIRYHYQRQIAKKLYPNLVVDDTEA